MSSSSSSTSSSVSTNSSDPSGGELSILPLLVSCSNGTCEEVFTVSCANAAAAKMITSSIERDGPEGIKRLQASFDEEYQIRIDLLHDFSITSSPITEFPREINGPFPPALIANIRHFEICEPILHKHQGPDATEESLYLRRFTIRFDRMKNGMWAASQPFWEALVSEKAPLVDYAKAYTQAKINRDVRQPLLNVLVEAYLENKKGPLQPKMLWDLQRVIANMSRNEPREVKPETPVSRFKTMVKRAVGVAPPQEQGVKEKALPVMETKSLGMYGQCSRQQAARMYRSACRPGNESKWKDCT